MRESPVSRVTVAEAFAKAALPLPATHLKSNTNNRDGTACTRSIHQQSFVTTASHPLTWSDHAGQSIRCVTVAETAVLMGFPSSWKLPTGSRLGIHALGNAVPPPFAKAIMRCAIEAPRDCALPALPHCTRQARRRAPHRPRCPAAVDLLASENAPYRIVSTAHCGGAWRCWRLSVPSTMPLSEESPHLQARGRCVGTVRAR